MANISWVSSSSSPLADSLTAQAMAQAMTASSNITWNGTALQQAINPFKISGGGSIGTGGAGGGWIMGGTPVEHFGMVRDIRKKFTQYTKEEFRHLSNKPVIKNIVMGMTKLNKDQIAERIKEHLED